MVPKQKCVLFASYRLFEPAAGHFHMRRRVVEVIEIVAKENGRNAGMIVANAIHHANLVVNVGNDQTGFMSVSHATERGLATFH